MKTRLSARPRIPVQWRDGMGRGGRMFVGVGKWVFKGEDAPRAVYGGGTSRSLGGTELYRTRLVAR